MKRVLTNGRGRMVRLAILMATMLLPACGGGDGTGPVEEPPLITVTGVADGGTYTGPVTVAVTINRGSYEATLNEAPLTGSTTVSVPGTYRLVVTARNGLAQATEDITFTIAGAAGGTLIIRLLDLGANASGGGGDAILVTDSSAAGMVHALIDAGPAGANASDEGYVARRLVQLGVTRLSFMQLTHAHADHFQGMTAVLNGIDVDRFYYNGQQRPLSFYNALLSTASQKADTVTIVTDSVPIGFGRGTPQTQLTILPPLGSYLTSTEDSRLINEGSLGTSLRRGDFRMFLTGDGEVEANNRWRQVFGGYTSNMDVLKVGHHGANDAIFDDGSGFNRSTAWLEHTNPDVAVISANGTTHARVRALDRLLQRNTTDTYCTNVHGEITIRVWSDGTYTVTPQKNAGLDCVPGSSATT